MSDQPQQAWYELLGTDVQIPADQPHGGLEYAGMDVLTSEDVPEHRPMIATLRKFVMPYTPATCVQPVEYLVPDDMSEADVFVKVCARHGIVPSLLSLRRWQGRP